MATAFKELYPDAVNPTSDVAARFLSDRIIRSNSPQTRYRHLLDVAGGILIESSEPELRPEVQAVLDRFIALSHLGPGWDTCNALTVEPSMYRPAVDVVLHALQRSCPPRVNASRHGGIVLNWDADDKELELEVEPGQEGFSAILVKGEEEFEPDAPISPEAAKSLIDQYCR